MSPHSEDVLAARKYHCSCCRLLHFYNALHAKWWNQDKWLQMVETRLQKTNWVYPVHHVSTLQMSAWLAGPAETILKGLLVKLVWRWNLCIPLEKNHHQPQLSFWDLWSWCNWIFPSSSFGFPLFLKTVMENNLMRGRGNSLPHHPHSPLIRTQMFKCRY